MPAMGGVRLRMALESAGLWADRNHVTLAELAEWFPRYLYLPRVRDRDTLIEAIRDGAMTLTPEDTFAVAEAYDEAADPYLGLSPAGGAPSVIDNRTCIVKTDVARAQLEDDAGPESAGDDAPDTPAGSDSPTALEPDAEQQRPLPTSFVGPVTLDGDRVGKSAGQIADEIISHLGALPGARVKVAMEIHVQMPEGADERVVRTVRENASTLKSTMWHSRTSKQRRSWSGQAQCRAVFSVRCSDVASSPPPAHRGLKSYSPSARKTGAHQWPSYTT